MSFILDALKKAESERNRQLGPVLMNARVAPPRRPLPAWGWVLAVVLVANLAVLAWLLLRTPATAPEVADGAARSAAPRVTAPAGNPADAAPPVPAGGTPAAGASLPVAATPAMPPRAATPSLSSDAEQLPTAQDLQAQGVVLPVLQLNLHIYDPEPVHRSILLNGQRLREGEFTPDGVRVERITEQSVVLEAAGRRFRIVAGG
jgi:general secretion pathway protein B